MFPVRMNRPPNSTLTDAKPARQDVLELGRSSDVPNLAVIQNSHAVFFTEAIPSVFNSVLSIIKGRSPLQIFYSVVRRIAIYMACLPSKSRFSKECGKNENMDILIPVSEFNSKVSITSLKWLLKMRLTTENRREFSPSTVRSNPPSVRHFVSFKSRDRFPNFVDRGVRRCDGFVKQVVSRVHDFASEVRRGIRCTSRFFYSPLFKESQPV